WTAALGWSLLVLLTCQARAEEPNAGLPLVAPAKALTAPDSQSQGAARSAAMPQTQRPQPTLPGGKLPQYQLSRGQRLSDSVEFLKDSTLTFILALPGQPILVRAIVTI